MSLKVRDRFTYSDSSLDGQSKKKAYTLIESGLLDSMEQNNKLRLNLSGNLTLEELEALHYAMMTKNYGDIS